MILNHKKIIFLILSLFVLTGCTINYNLIIDNNEITEKITLINENIEITDDTLNTIKDD